jgi:D-psicose/D-tagatose/L-ribulose 3-epimerase
VNLAVSNIAWLPEEDAAAFDILRTLGVSLLELAPSRKWIDPSIAGVADAQGYRKELRVAGFSVAAFQAILFGKPELTIFESPEARRKCIDYLVQIAQLAAACGARPLVFGAPKNRRVPEGMPLVEADRIARDFFSELARRTADLRVSFCLEPNPTGYGCNYLTHVAGAARIVREVNSPGLRLQIDAGELAMNSESVEQVIKEQADIIGHVHISQAMLVGFENPWEGHATLAQTLAQINYGLVLSIEMKRPTDGLAGVQRAIEFARECYAAV